ncbi:MAG: hypothetical protein LBC21_03250 [Oscillospiraceae bacterium]|jgi:hypothetical protein|nr:hypothetical protein [Oscillospiraceae bacterium]
MNEKTVPTASPLGSDRRLGAALCISLFLCGCFAGAAAAGALSPGGLRDCLSGIAGALAEEAGAEGGAAYLSRLLSVCKYHIAAVFFGFSVLGVVCIPALAAARGFFLCFTVAALARSFGVSALTLGMFATCVAVSAPCFFILSVQSFSSSLSLLRAAAGRPSRARDEPFGSGFFVRCAMCVPALAGCALIDAMLIPRVVTFLSLRPAA